MNKMLRILLLQILLFGQLIRSDAQTTGESKIKSTGDSLKRNFVSRMQAFAKKSAKESAEEFNADKAVIAQTKILNDIRGTMQRADLYLKAGLDTTGAKKQLAEIEKYYKVAGDGVFTDKGSAQTFRNLTATSKILAELLNQSGSRKERLAVYEHDLTAFRYELDSLLSQPPLFRFPNDSAVLARYMQNLFVVAQEVHPVDSALKVANTNVQLLFNQYSLQVIKLQGSLKEIDLYQKHMARNTFKREFGNIWGSIGYFRPFNEILQQARSKGGLTLLFYLQNNAWKLIVLALLILTSFIYLRSLKSIYVERKLLDENYDGQLVLKRPLLSALLIVVNVFQFIFISPPFLLNVIFYCIVSVSLSIVFNKFITRYWMLVWLIAVGLFLTAAADNLILQASRPERWFMLVLSLAGVVTGAVVAITNPKSELREKWILFSIHLMTLLEFASALSNILGRYNLSKTLLIAGFLNVVVAILFLWTVRLINEGLYLAFNVYSRQDKKLFYLNFDKVGQKAPLIFYLFLIIGWCVLFGRNFAGFDDLSKPLQEFFHRDRTLGDYTFSINRILLFGVIMGIAVIVSKIVSYFASDNDLHTDTGKTNRQGLGSWLLLVRITILSIGLFLGIAAAGIPVDRITIILGALGVGIGFGLQTLVNNLVSGLIIAFEKPVNVGDVVEVDGHGGTMKSIGFRSSIIATWDGADMVMPNGDLLNSHLNNWSSGGNLKRSSILIGISYDADLNKAKEVLTGLIKNDSRIAAHPAPVVQYEQFNDSSIDVRIYFWAKHMAEAASIQSDLIMAITAAFAENSIEIPFPHRDVYLHHPIKQDFEEAPQKA